ncbi:hypothetical protein NC652_034131 [Populus alba x Populus x berolinensis]|nr:hypothetical protein NC652_034131 [Populus alba x Populus x berolinensis]
MRQLVLQWRERSRKDGLSRKLIQHWYLHTYQLKGFVCSIPSLLPHSFQCYDSFLKFSLPVSMKARAYVLPIADCLPNRNLVILVPVLERFVAFHLTLNMISPETHKAVTEVIESCRI